MGSGDLWPRAARRPPLDRQGSAQGQRNQGQGGEGRPQAGRERGNARSVAGHGEAVGVVQAHQAQPPVPLLLRGAGPARARRASAHSGPVESDHPSSMRGGDSGPRRIRPSARPQDTGHRPNWGSEISSSPPGAFCMQTAGRAIRLGGKPSSTPGPAPERLFLQAAVQGMRRPSRHLARTPASYPYCSGSVLQHLATNPGRRRTATPTVRRPSPGQRLM